MGIEVRCSPWGVLSDGTPLHLFTLAADGLRVGLTDFGASLVSIEAPDRDGLLADVLVGFKTAAAMQTSAARAARPCFGAIVGRVANRIADARFMLDGVEHRLPANEGRHHLHGGPHGFDLRRWTPEMLPDGVAFGLVSPAGDAGYPGTLHVQVTYRAVAAGTLEIAIAAESDAATPVNIASHGYFNLAGQDAATIDDHHLTVAADHVLATDPDGIPTDPSPVADTPFDFRTMRRIGAALANDHPHLRGGGLDHCFILRADGGPAAVLADPASGRRLALATDQPGLQLYSANALDGTLADGAGRTLRRRQALAMEAQHFPDSPNRPDFPNTILRPGARYASTTTLRFSAD